MATQIKILMLEAMAYGDDVSLEQFNKYGELITYDVSSQDEAIERMKKHNPDVVVANKVIMSAELMQAAPNLKMIAEAATGYNNIDIAYAKEHGIRVANVAGYSTKSVIQHTFAMCFYLLEKLRYYDGFVKSGEYSDWPCFSHFQNTFNELDGKIWGIVGLGEIGKGVAKIAEDFGCEVVYYSPSDVTQDVPYRKVDLDELLNKSDIISIHTPLNEKTKNLFNYDNISRMKESALLLNLARGPIVNDADLARALDEELIAGAGLDVVSVEPIEKENPLLEIRHRDRLFITPHIAWATVESRTRLLDEVYKNIVAYFNGEERNVIV